MQSPITRLAMMILATAVCRAQVPVSPHLNAGHYRFYYNSSTAQWSFSLMRDGQQVNYAVQSTPAFGSLSQSSDSANSLTTYTPIPGPPIGGDVINMSVESVGVGAAIPLSILPIKLPQYISTEPGMSAKLNAFHSSQTPVQISLGTTFPTPGHYYLEFANSSLAEWRLPETINGVAVSNYSISGTPGGSQNIRKTTRGTVAMHGPIGQTLAYFADSQQDSDLPDNFTLQVTSATQSAALILHPVRVPQWWVDQGLASPLSARKLDNNAAATIGQAKFVTAAALRAIKLAVPTLFDNPNSNLNLLHGKAVTRLEELQSQWLASLAQSNAQDSDILVVGQAKSMASLFIDSLWSLSLAEPSSRIGGASRLYPWPAASDDPRVAVTTGQLRELFRIEFKQVDSGAGADTDEDGLAAACEAILGSNSNASLSLHSGLGTNAPTSDSQYLENHLRRGASPTAVGESQISDENAARFLWQASWGPRREGAWLKRGVSNTEAQADPTTIEAVKRLGYEGWINEQITKYGVDLTTNNKTIWSPSATWGTEGFLANTVGKVNYYPSNYSLGSYYWSNSQMDSHSYSTGVEWYLTSVLLNVASSPYPRTIAPRPDLPADIYSIVTVTLGAVATPPTEPCIITWTPPDLLAAGTYDHVVRVKFVKDSPTDNAFQDVSLWITSDTRLAVGGNSSATSADDATGAAGDGVTRYIATGWHGRADGFLESKFADHADSEIDLRVRVQSKEGSSASPPLRLVLRHSSGRAMTPSELETLAGKKIELSYPRVKLLLNYTLEDASEHLAAWKNGSGEAVMNGSRYPWEWLRVADPREAGDVLSPPFLNGLATFPAGAPRPNDSSLRPVGTARPNGLWDVDGYPRRFSTEAWMFYLEWRRKILDKEVYFTNSGDGPQGMIYQSWLRRPTANDTEDWFNLVKRRRFVGTGLFDVRSALMPRQGSFTLSDGFDTNTHDGPEDRNTLYLMRKFTYAWGDASESYPITRKVDYANFHSALIRRCLNDPDQLRQRMAWALSQILVVSNRSTQLYEHAGNGFANYWDILNDHALGNYADLVARISVHPIMGYYLSHAYNKSEHKIDGGVTALRDREDGTRGRYFTPDGYNQIYQNSVPNFDSLPGSLVMPDENFARELLQLFTVGTYQHSSSGVSSTKSYDQETVKALARVYTGLAPSYTPGRRQFGFGADFAFQQDLKLVFTRPMVVWSPYHDYRAKIVQVAGESSPLTLPAVTTVAGSGIAGEKAWEMKAREEMRTASDYLAKARSTSYRISRILIQHLVTSNPSQAYVNAVADEFYNTRNQANQLGLVAKKILLHPEARNAESFLASDQSGRIKDPMLRAIGAMRVLSADEDFNRLPLANPGSYPTGSVQETYFAPPEGLSSSVVLPCTGSPLNGIYWPYMIGSAGQPAWTYMRAFGQAPFNAPSVFNFYQPDYHPPGALAQRNLMLPESQLLTVGRVGGSLYGRWRETEGSRGVSLSSRRAWQRFRRVNHFWNGDGHGFPGYTGPFHMHGDFKRTVPLFQLMETTGSLEAHFVSLVDLVDQSQAVSGAAAARYGRVIDELNIVFCSGRMTARTREVLLGTNVFGLSESSLIEIGDGGVASLPADEVDRRRIRLAYLTLEGLADSSVLK